MTYTRAHNPQTPRRTSGGFTLVELLMAMFILAIGLVGVVSIFPVATYLQRESYDQIMTQSLTRNVEALIDTRGISWWTLENEGNIPDELTDPNDVAVIHPVPDGMLEDGGDWPLSTRCYPMVIEADQDASYTPNEDADFGEDPDFEARDFYWVPLVRDAARERGRSWEVYVFILKKDDEATYEAEGETVANEVDPDQVPRVVEYDVERHPDENAVTITVPGSAVDDGDLKYDIIGVGDQFLTSDGQVMTALAVRWNEGSLKVFITGDVDTNASFESIWCAPYAEGSATSPTMRILSFGAEAVK